MRGAPSKLRRVDAVLIVCILLYATFLSGLVLSVSSNKMARDSAVNGQQLVWCCGRVSNLNESWYVVTPPSEKGNITSQAQYLADDYRDIGVILDDFDLQNQSIQSAMLSIVPNRFGDNVCPVVSGDGLLTGIGSNTPDTKCVVIVVEPYAFLGAGRERKIFLLSSQEARSGIANSTSVGDWASAIDSMISNEGGGRNVFLLIYDHPYSGWPSPIPTNYLIAGREYAESHDLGLIIWI